MPSDDDDDESLREQIKEASTAAFHKIEASAPPSVAVRLRRFREALRRNRGLDTAWRVMVFALGVTLMVAGVIMFVIPGPGGPRSSSASWCSPRSSVGPTGH
jgi:hypothetical protein